MSENLMCQNHKSTTKEYRDNYDRTFGFRKVKVKFAKRVKYKPKLTKHLVKEENA